MNLAFYSGGTVQQNDSMNREVFDFLRQQDCNEIVYITTPYQKNEYAQIWLKEFVSPYFSPKLTPYFVDKPNNQDSITALARAKAVVLTGGNTFYLLKHLKESGTDKLLIAAARQGALLVGVSAGAMVLTPSIATAAIPSYDCDENTIGIHDLSGIELVKYELAPHYEPTEIYDKELREYSRTNGRPIYLLQDGSGMFIQNGREKLFGSISMMDNGEKAKIVCAQ